MNKLALFLSSVLIFMTAVYSAYAFRSGVFSPISSSFADSELTVILDPGHGGFDGGATAVDGTAEKDFNLQISLILREYLELYGFRVVMTRTEDASTDSVADGTIRERKVDDIHNRLSLVNETDNCILLSIHQNYFEDPSCCGTQVFYSANTTQGKELAEAIQREIVSLLQPENTRLVKSAGKEIYLLNNAQKPAVLVECGFISNRNDTIKLQDESYRKKISFCIAKAVFDYYKNDRSTG
ncbi:MAG: N-acetylmuramoyl-L-alanine amidase [Clostridia bacterium]|nr:N-acetylmuramoyl-L-alanine amidase [Clostridia bacterium]